MSIKIRLLPKSKFGRFTIYLFLSFVVFFAIFELFILSGQRGGQGFFDNLYLTVPFLLAAVSGVISFFTGMYSVFFQKERSILVILATFWGLFVLLFVTGEIVFPH